MAKKETVEEAEEETPGPGGKKKLIIIVAAAVLLIGVVVGAAFMFIGGADETEAQADAEKEVVAVSKGEATYVDLKPAFTVNLAPDDSVGFLQISLQVLTYSDDVAAELEKHKPLIRNNLVLLFARQKSIDLRALEGKENLQKAALETLQSVIDKYGSGGEIDNVFFTSFVMQ